MRYLWLISLLLTFSLPVRAQSNPSEAPCGLPKWGQIVKTVTYDLTDDCAQDYFLEIETAKIPDVPLTLTINGNGHTITYAKGIPDRFNFLVVDDKGISTPQNVDTPPSPHVKVIIRDVTFDAEDVLFRRFPRQLPDGSIGSRSGIGAWILTDGPLEMENVTFKRGNGIWVRAKGETSLTNVLFEDSQILNWGISSRIRGVLYVTKTGRVTVHNGVFRDIGLSVVSVQQGGHLRTTGCLSFIRTYTHNVHHSGLYDGLGTWSDSSTGPCTSSNDPVGNGGSAVDTYVPTLLDCGLPASGIIGVDTVYTLNRDCVCVAEVIIATGVRVTINANGHRIEGCDNAKIRIGGFASLQINKARIYGIRLYNWGGDLTVGNSMIAETSPIPIMNYGFFNAFKTTFQDNHGYSDGRYGRVYYATDLFRLGRAVFRDNMFRRNSDGEADLLAKGAGTSIILCGENERGDPPPEDNSIVATPLFLAIEGGAILGCSDNHPTSAPAGAECPPGPAEQPAKRALGAIGVILYVEKCPLTIEVWEVLPNSQGQFALRMSQDMVEAMNEGETICSANGRAALRIGLTEPVRQILAYSKTYVPPSRRGGRDILVSIGPNYEQKVHHLVIDHALDGTVMGFVDTRPAGPPCEDVVGAPGQFTAQAAPATPAPPPPPTPIPMAAPVFPQPAKADGSIVHVVQPGDTIWAIGVAYDVHPYRIISLNRLDDTWARGGFIAPGQELLIRPAS